MLFFLDYGEADWRKLTTQNLDNVECYHDEVKKNFGATLDWYDILFIFQSFFKSFFFSISFKNFTCNKNLAEHLTKKKKHLIKILLKKTNNSAKNIE